MKLQKYVRVKGVPKMTLSTADKLFKNLRSIKDIREYLSEVKVVLIYKVDSVVLALPNSFKGNVARVLLTNDDLVRVANVSNSKKEFIKNVAVTTNRYLIQKTCIDPNARVVRIVTKEEFNGTRNEFHFTGFTEEKRISGSDMVVEISEKLMSKKYKVSITGTGFQLSEVVKPPYFTRETITYVLG